MLQKLYIKNFAIIKELHQDWKDNLTIITGETGAGKSILLGAVELILGNRLDHTSILNKDEKCIIEAHFKIAEKASVNKILIQKEFEVFDELIIRREINPAGRSRAFINDTPARLEDLAKIGKHLINLHRQFDNYDLLQRGEQMAILDDYLQLNDYRANYQKTFADLNKAQKELSSLTAEAQKAKAEQDYMQFVFDEIDELQLKGNEIESWESKLLLLENAQQIKEQMLNSADVLINNEQSVVDSLQVISKELKNYTDSADEIKSISERLVSAIEELKDIATELEIQESNISTDEEELQIITERLEKANKLLLKHSATNTAELIKLRDEFSEKLLSITTIGGNMAAASSRVDLLTSQAKIEAEKLSKKRVKGIKQFMKAVNAMLPDLGFTNAKFDIEHSFKEMSNNGIDEIEFQFDANNTGTLQPIVKAISGGEMSRVMLIIKSLLAHSSEMPCMIFDEIDTGISGETALKVGGVLKELANKHQVISITHLPQIAAQADQHLFVYKKADTKKNDQQTSIRELEKEERVQIIAEMLSGKRDSDSATRAAQDLLQRN